MIIVTPKTYDIDGAVSIQHVTGANDVNNVLRRVQRTATLDGDSVFVDHGFSNSDRTFTIGISRIAEATALRLAAIVESHTRVYATVNGASFECIPDAFRLIGGDGSLTLLVVSKVS